MGRMVITPLAAISITSSANQDVFSLMAASTNKLKLHGWEITSAATSAVISAIKLQRITLVGNGGAAATAVMLDKDDGAITGSVRTGDTTPGTAGDIMAGFQWEQLGPLGMIYTPEMRPVIDVSNGIALLLVTAVAITASGWVAWEEL